MKLHLQVADQIESNWLDMVPIRLGPVPSGLPTPDAYVLVESGGRAVQRLDVYFPPSAHNFRTKASHWRGWIAVGCCNLVHLVSTSDGEAITIPVAELGTSFDYFSDFWRESDFLLVITGQGLVRIDPDGSVRWQNHRLGLDGVTVRDVLDGCIEGQGDMDPPGDWKPFRIKVETGERK